MTFKNVFENFLSTYWNDFFGIALHFKLKEPNSMEPYNGKRAHLKCNSLSTSFSQAVLSFFFFTKCTFHSSFKVIYPKYYKHRFFTVAATTDWFYFDPKKYTLKVKDRISAKKNSNFSCLFLNPNDFLQVEF